MLYIKHIITWVFAGYTRMNVVYIATLCIIDIVNPSNVIMPLLNTVAFINSVAICTSFNSAYMFDSSVFERFASKCKVTMPQFHVINMITHVLPVIICATKPLIPYYGVQASMISCFIHCIWPLLTYRTIYLNDIYIQLFQTMYG